MDSLDGVRNQRKYNQTTMGSNSNELSIDDYVGIVTKRNVQGDLGNFKMPDNKWLFKNIKGGRKGMGGKKESWVLTIEKQSKKVPGVGAHLKY